MRKRRLFLYFPILAIFLLLGGHYNWVHAAIIATFSKKCSGDLEIDARKNVKSLFGLVQSRPFFACQQAPIMGRIVDYGTTDFASFMPSIIVLGKFGTNINVASHEYTHAELAERTSVLLRTFRIPTWFDEGLAMQLDNRSQYSKTALNTYLKEGLGQSINLQKISRPSTFYRPGNLGRLNYAFAKCVVNQWLKHHGRSEMLRLIEEIGWTEPFPIETFEKYEDNCLSNTTP